MTDFEKIPRFECRVGTDPASGNILVIGKVGDKELGFAIVPGSDIDVAKHLIELRDALHAPSNND